ncbi:MAG TPA: enoyl-CoA hydratase-related protein [Acidimicrobiales bacterium]
MSDKVHAEVRGRVLVIELRRPEKRNAVDHEVTDGLSAALDRLEDDPELWAGVLTGGPSFFSAGTDLRVGSTSTPRGGPYGIIRRRRHTPLIAAVEGPALGGGTEIVLACDLVVASATAVFGLPEVELGLVPNCAGLFRAPRALPINVARELLLTGGRLDVERAERLGLVNRIVPAGEALDAAVAMAEEIATRGPVAVRETMRALEGFYAEEDERGFSLTDAAETAIQASADAQEGVAAFLEKREPRWSNR